MTRKQASKHYETFCGLISHLDQYHVTLHKSKLCYYLRITSEDGFFGSPLLECVFRFKSLYLDSSYNVVFSSSFRKIEIVL